MKKIINFTFCLFWVSSLFAQAEYVVHPVTNNQSGYGCEDSYLADFDGDGDLDVVAGFSRNARVIWFENTDGFGAFTQKEVISTSMSNVSTVFAIDIDMDGDMDVLSASKGPFAPKVVWFENLDGLGSFGPEKLIENKYANYLKVLACDIDGDLDADVVVLSTDGLYWYKNEDGHGAFGSRIFMKYNMKTVDLYDMDKDGDLDFLMGIGKEVRIYPNNNDGVFTDYVSIDVDESVAHVATDDFDGDGFVDVLASGVKGLYWFKNMDNGASFIKNEVSFLGGFCTVTTTRLLASGDADGDGDIDVFTTLHGKKFWYENEDGKGTFEDLHSFNDVITTPVSIVAVDMDIDGDVDLLETNYFNVSWYENDGIGNSIATHPVTRSISYNCILSDDIDNDGQKDLISSSRVVGCMWYKQENGTDSWTEKSICSNEIANLVVAVGDVNNDGFPDVLARKGLNKLILLKNQNINFDTGTLLSNAFSLQKAIFTDLDGDGDLDVVALELGRVFWIENTDGQGTFSAPKHILSLNEPASVSAADMDNDGDLDLLLFSKGNKLVEWLENLDGQGTFKNYGHFHKVLEGENGIVSLSALDYDKDGDIDIVGKLGGKAIWFENLDGNGNFSSQNAIQDVPGFRVRIADMNQDGSYDLISYGMVLNQLSGLLGNQGFGDAVQIGLARGINLVDIDGDGDLDIEIETESITDISNIFWYENLLTPLTIHDDLLTKVSIFPVPLSDELFIDADRSIEQIVILDELGQFIKAKRHANSISVFSLSKGLYFCKIIDDTGRSFVFKVVKL